MKKTILAILAMASLMVACKKNTVPTYNVTANFQVEGVPLTVSDLGVSLVGDNTTLSAVTDANGSVKFEAVAAGSYEVALSASVFVDGYKIVYNGSKKFSVVDKDVDVAVDVTESTASQLIIKELYCGGCPKDDASGAYQDDKYITIYNNSETEVDASDLVIGIVGPSVASNNKYYNAETKKLAYADEDWLPAYSAIWWFQSKVTIPAFSEITIAIFGAIDHTQTMKNSVNLSNSKYYWMSNKEVEKFTAPKYQVAESIPTANYLTTSPISIGSAWVISNMCPAIFIGKMAKNKVIELSNNTDAFDYTLGKNIACAKFPRANVLDGIEVFQQSDIEKSIERFTSDINTGYVSLVQQQGHTLYRNVDLAATEAIEGNAAKLVKGYKADPSGIDAEASIKAGAKIVYKDTNNSGNDFHEREKAAIK